MGFWFGIALWTCVTTTLYMYGFGLERMGELSGFISLMVSTLTAGIAGYYLDLMLRRKP